MIFFHHLYQFTSAATFFSTFDHISDFVLVAKGGGGCAAPPTRPLFLKGTHAGHSSSFDIIS